MMDKVPLLLEDINAVHVNIVVTPPGPPRAEGTVRAADNGNSAFNYINEKWAQRMGIGWETPNAEKVFVDQVNGLDLPCNILGCVTLSVRRDASRAVSLPFFVFRPNADAHYEKLILGLRRVPIGVEPTSVAQAGTPIRPGDGTRVSVFGTGPSGFLASPSHPENRTWEQLLGTARTSVANATRKEAAPRSSTALRNHRDR
jgi:hypothetical protein